jgi:hypothetical protein
MGSVCELASEWLTPIYQHIKTGVMAGGYVQLDETPVDYLGAGRALKGYLWTGSRPGGDGVPEPVPAFWGEPTPQPFLKAS